MKRLFIEIDKASKDEIETLGTLCSYLHGLNPEMNDIKNFFDTIIDEAAFNGNIWNEVKKHDEIYASTSLIPRFGYGSSFGSGMLFNNLMYKAVEENIEGKKIFIFREYNQIRWYELERELVEKAFVKNELYVENKDSEKWERVNIDKLLNEEL